MAEVNIVVQPAVGWAEATCEACGKQKPNYVELHLRHTGKKVVLCGECDQDQLTKPRMVRTTSGR